MNPKQKIRGRKARTFCFRKTIFVHSRSGTYYSLLLRCFGLKSLQDVRHCVYLFLVRFEPHIRPTRLAISFLLITARAKSNVRSCVKLFDFFRGWILIRLTWNLSRFIPNSVEILMWNFIKKLFRENFSKIFAQTKAIHYLNLWNFALLSAIFILRPYSAEKIHTSTFIWCLHPGKEARP